MKIYTSYFAACRNIPKNIIRVSICIFPPKSFDCLSFKKVAPKHYFFNKWKENNDNDYYVESFNSEVLDKLDPQLVYNELFALTGGKDCVLLCYEKSGDFCHRHLVSEWLNRTMNLGIEEYQFI